jgi:hypothetical protein
MFASRSRGDVRNELQRFLFDHVESYEELELAVLLRRQRERDWSPAQAAAELRLSPSSCLGALEGLERRGIVVRGALAGTFRYAPCSLELAARLAQLDECYRSQRLSVVMLMGVNAIERLRIATIHRFADTLRLRDPKR